MLQGAVSAEGYCGCCLCSGLLGSTSSTNTLSSTASTGSGSSGSVVTVISAGAGGAGGAGGGAKGDETYQSRRVVLANHSERPLSVPPAPSRQDSMERGGGGVGGSRGAGGQSTLPNSVKKEERGNGRPGAPGRLSQ